MLGAHEHMAARPLFFDPRDFWVTVSHLAIDFESDAADNLHLW